MVTGNMHWQSRAPHNYFPNSMTSRPKPKTKEWNDTFKRRPTWSFSLEANPKLTMSVRVVSEITSWVHLCNISAPTQGPWHIPMGNSITSIYMAWPVLDAAESGNPCGKKKVYSPRKALAHISNLFASLIQSNLMKKACEALLISALFDYSLRYQILWYLLS